jgi:hypothetical protein
MKFKLFDLIRQVSLLSYLALREVVCWRHGMALTVMNNGVITHFAP